MPQADITTFFFLVENFLFLFYLSFLFGLLFSYLQTFNNIKFFFTRKSLFILNKLS